MDADNFKVDVNAAGIAVVTMDFKDMKVYINMHTCIRTHIHLPKQIRTSTRINTHAFFAALKAIGGRKSVRKESKET